MGSKFASLLNDNAFNNSLQRVIKGQDTGDQNTNLEVDYEHPNPCIGRVERLTLIKH